MLFEREDWTLFRTLPTLAQKAGVPVNDISKLIAKLMAEHGVKERAMRLAQAAEGSGVSAADIEQYLEQHPTQSWRGGTDAIAQRLASNLVA